MLLSTVVKYLALAASAVSALAPTGNINTFANNDEGAATGVIDLSDGNFHIFTVRGTGNSSTSPVLTLSSTKLSVLTFQDLLCEGDSFVVYDNSTAIATPLAAYGSDATKCDPNQAQNTNPASIADPLLAQEPRIFLARNVAHNLTVAMTNSSFSSASIGVRAAPVNVCIDPVNTRYRVIQMPFALSPGQLNQVCVDAINSNWRLSQLNLNNIGKASGALRTCTNGLTFGSIASWNGDSYPQTPCGILLMAGVGDSNQPGAIVQNFWCDVPQVIVCQQIV